MKGNPKVIAELNKALREELTAINQYFLHAEMCENWKYHRLAEIHQETIHRRDEAAEVLIERIVCCCPLGELSTRTRLIRNPRLYRPKPSPPRVG